MSVRRLFALLILTAGSILGSAHAGEVNIYSARKEALIKPLLDDFTLQTGIKVNLVTGKADALLKRLESEGRNTLADLLITVDAGRLHRAKQARLLQTTDSDEISRLVPAQYRDYDRTWVGLSLRSRTIMVVADKVKPDEIQRYEDLADPKWKGRICIRSSDNIYNQSLVASMIATSGEAATEHWAKGLIANLARPPKGGDRDQIKAAAAGQCDVAIANTYYLARMLKNEKDQGQHVAATKMRVIWPNQADRGAHVNVSGAAITRHAKNPDNALKLVEFLLNRNSQLWYADKNNEYPVTSNVAISTTLQTWGGFKSDTVNLSKLGEYNTAAVKLMDRAGWK